MNDYGIEVHCYLCIHTCIIFSTVTVCEVSKLRIYLHVVTILISVYAQFLSPVPHMANVTLSSYKPFNLTCLGAYYSPNDANANERVIWEYPPLPPTDFPPLDLSTIRTNILVFVETSPSLSGRFACRSRDTNELLSEYFVTFVPGENCLHSSLPVMS